MSTKKRLFTVTINRSPKPAKVVEFYSPRQAHEFLAKVRKKGARAEMTVRRVRVKRRGKKAAGAR